MKFNSELLEITNSDMPSFSLFEGGYISKFTLAYETYGELNSNKDNAILLFHALTGSQHAAGTNTDGPGIIDGDDINQRWNDEMYTGWWDGFIGSGKALDTDKAIKALDIRYASLLRYDKNREILKIAKAHASLGNKTRALIIMDRLFQDQLKKYTYEKEDYSSSSPAPSILWLIDDIIQDNNLDFHSISFWKLEKYSCVLLKRNKQWFTEQYPLMKKFWERVEYHKKNGYEELMNKKETKVKIPKFAVNFYDEDDILPITLPQTPPQTPRAHRAVRRGYRAQARPRRQPVRAHGRERICGTGPGHLH